MIEIFLPHDKGVSDDVGFTLISEAIEAMFGVAGVKISGGYSRNELSGRK
jgi:hypothetical protein